MLIPVHRCSASGTAAKFSVRVVAHAIVDDDRVSLLDYFWTLHVHGHAGTFDTIEEAVAARDATRERLGIQ